MGVQLSKREKIYYSLIGFIGIILLIIEIFINKSLLVKYGWLLLLFLPLAIVANRKYIVLKKFIFKFDVIYVITAYFVLNYITALCLLILITIIKNIGYSKKEKLKILNEIGMISIVFVTAHYTSLYIISKIGISNLDKSLLNVFILMISMFVFSWFMLHLQFNIIHEREACKDFKVFIRHDFLSNSYVIISCCINYYLYNEMLYVGMFLGLCVIIIISYLITSLLQLKKHNKDLIVVSEIAAAMASKLDLRETLANIINGVCKSLDPDFCAIFEYDKGNNQLNLIDYKMILRFGLGIRIKDINKVVNENIDVITNYRNSVIIGDLYLLKNKLKNKSNNNVISYFRSIIYEPLILENNYFGCIMIARKERDFFYKEQLKIADIITNHAVIAYKNAKMFKKVKNESIRDSLTGLYNQRQFFAALEDININKRNNVTSLIIFDIDKFKNINDTYGHQTGDKIIKEISYIINSNIRKQDIVYRYGGEEFTVVLPKTNQIEAFKIGERVRYIISKETFYSCDGRKIDITISGGVSEFPKIADSSTKLLSYADRALYNGAKQKGRNKVSLYT